MKIKELYTKKFLSTKEDGFGLVDAILSLTLLAGIITYGFYFSSLRLSTLYSANLIRSINKELDMKYLLKLTTELKDMGY